MVKVRSLDRGFVVWFTGLPASGKTTLARRLENVLKSAGMRVEVLDGDEVRKNLSPDLGFGKEDREMHARRVAYISKLLSRNGVVVLVALISPYRKFRRYARRLIGDFIEVYVRCPLRRCMERDTKGLYQKALKGEINNLTGLQDPYEEPLEPELILDTEKESPEHCVSRLISRLHELGYVDLTDIVTPQVNR